MRASTIERERVAHPGRHPRERRTHKVAVSLIGMGLGDRIVLEAPLRSHRASRPADYMIALEDRHSRVDLPEAVRRHFDEIWWMANGRGTPWDARGQVRLARRVRDALLAAGVRTLYVPHWRRHDFPRNRACAIRPYNCFSEARRLAQGGLYPRLSVPRAETVWAGEFLRVNLPPRFEAFVAVHVRGVCYGTERNLNAGLVQRIIERLRARGRLAFLLLGRDDRPPALAAPDVFSFVGMPWRFERTAALLARAGLFIGGESSLTHAAAALRVPLVAVGYDGLHAVPFAPPDRFLWFVKGAAPETILAETEPFAARVGLFSARRNHHGKKAIAESARAVEAAI